MYHQCKHPSLLITLHDDDDDDHDDGDPSSMQGENAESILRREIKFVSIFATAPSCICEQRKVLCPT